jgi:hypothetical protein
MFVMLCYWFLVLGVINLKVIFSIQYMNGVHGPMKCLFDAGAMPRAQPERSTKCQ